ncbi:hypothetical protein [uncultured Kocuria sp.]|uniref:hypothetical protein n=1 Tax=uncultured Kocuria sp. TaxID=259305 RepID=UPI0026224AB3|nr:hypothetical protein [uncultured Kocuria sp.]
MGQIESIAPIGIVSVVVILTVLFFFLFKGNMLSMDFGHMGKLMITKTEDVQKNDKNLETHGNPDQFHLLFKAQSSSWIKSTKAMNVPGGCLVQMSTDRKQKNGSWVSAETSTFLPNAHVVPDENGNFTIRAVEQQKSDNKRDPEIRASLWMV